MQQPQMQMMQMLAYVALAIFLGGLVGLDREAARKPAGLRTHMLVSGAAALLVICEPVALVQWVVIPRGLEYVENRFDEEPVPASPGEERP